jgi:hypothetical protein
MKKAMTREQLKLAVERVREGRAARLAAQAEGDMPECPYATGSVSWGWWMDGWDQIDLAIVTEARAARKTA